MPVQIHKGENQRLAHNLYATWKKEHPSRYTRKWPCGHTITHTNHPEGFPQRQDPCQPPGLDHPEMHILLDGRRVAIYHPYGAPDQKEIDAFDERWGTQTKVFPPEESWYYPNYSHRVEVWGPPLYT